MLALVFPVVARAETIVLQPVADTTLSQNNPSNNFGAMTFNITGTTQNYTKNRALYRFDFSTIPAGSRIEAVSLKLEVVHVPNEPPTPASVSLHRLIAPWGEGSKGNSGSGAGNGSPATTNEATWLFRLAYTTNTWAAPGGAVGLDFVALNSAANTLYEVSDYYFPPVAGTTTPELIADVQLWLDQPATNFGWLLLCDNEGDNFTARRIGTREDSVNTPLLTVTYTPFVFGPVVATGNQFQFTVPVFAGRATEVQFSDSLTSTNRQTLTNIPAPSADTTCVLGDTLSAPQRFYHLVVP